MEQARRDLRNPRERSHGSEKERFCPMIGRNSWATFSGTVKMRAVLTARPVCLPECGALTDTRASETEELTLIVGQVRRCDETVSAPLS